MQARNAGNKPGGTRGPASRHQLKTDPVALRAWMAERKIANQADLAAYLGVGVATANRACQGQAIGEEFVSALGKKVSRKRLGSFFVYTDNLPVAA